MEKFTRQDAKAMREEIADALSKIAKKYNAEVSVGSITYGIELKTSIRFQKITENEHGDFVMTNEAQRFLDRAHEWGLSKDVLNEPCKYNGKEYRVIGYNKRAKRYPILMLENGKKMKCTVDFMLEFVRAERPELFL